MRHFPASAAAFTTATLLTCALWAGQARATTLTWGNNSGNGQWDTTSANWGDGTTLYSDPNVVIFGTTAVGTVTLTSNLNPNSVSIQGGSPLGAAYKLTGGAGSNHITTTNVSIGDNRALHLGSTGVLGSSAVVNFQDATTWTYFSLNGNNQTVAGLATSGTHGVMENGYFSQSAADATLTINNVSNYAYQGIVRDNDASGGKLSLTKQGSGTQTLAPGSGSLSYTGDTNVYDNGTLVFQGATSLASNVFVHDTAVVKVDTSTANGQYSLKGFSVDAAAAVELYSTNTTADGVLLTGATAFTGTGTIRKTGAGYLDITWSQGTPSINGFNGTFDVQNGTLGVNNGVAGSGNATVQIASGASVDIRTGTFKIDALNGVSGSSVSCSFNGGNTLSLGNNGGSGAFAGVISNGASSGLALVKNGAGTQTLSGANSYTGTTTVHDGTLVMKAPTDANWTMPGSGNTIDPTATLRIDFTAQTTQYRTTAIQATAVDGTLELHSTAYDVNAFHLINSSGALTGNGTIAVTGGGAIAMWTGGANPMSGFTGTLDIQNGQFSSNVSNGSTLGGNFNVNVGASGKLDIRSGNFTCNALTGGGQVIKSYTAETDTFTVGSGDGSGTFTGALTGTNYNLVKTGSGTQTMSGDNTYTGTTTVTGGTLVVNRQNAGYPAVGGLSIASGATLTLQRSVSGSANPVGYTGASGAGTLNLQGNANSSATAIDGGWNMLQTSAVSLTGIINVQSGVFAAQSGSAWGGTTATMNVSSGAIFLCHNADATLGGLNGSGNVGTGWGTAQTLTVGNGGGNGAFSGNIYGNGTGAGNVSISAGVLNLVKTGAGTQTLSGTNAYSGTTAVDNGTLLVTGSHSGAGNYAVNAGGTLGGGTTLGISTPTITLAAGRNFTVASGGKITADTVGGIGQLNIASTGGAVNINGTYVFDVDYGANPATDATGDLVNIIGATSLDLSGSTFTLNAPGSAPAAGTRYAIRIFQSNVADAAYAGAGPHNLIGSTPGLNGLASYQSIVTWDNGKTFYLVPEPATFALLGLGGLLLLRRPTRRRGRTA